jgi:hypothetical protein
MSFQVVHDNRLALLKKEEKDKLNTLKSLKGDAYKHANIVTILISLVKKNFPCKTIVIYAILPFLGNKEMAILYKNLFNDLLRGGFGQKILMHPTIRKNAFEYIASFYGNIKQAIGIVSKQPKFVVKDWFAKDKKGLEIAIRVPQKRQNLYKKSETFEAFIKESERLDKFKNKNETKTSSVDITKPVEIAKCAYNIIKNKDMYYNAKTGGEGHTLFHIRQIAEKLTVPDQHTIERCKQIIKENG